MKENNFKPLNKELTKLRKAYKATQGVHQPRLEDFITIVRKIKGVQKIKALTTIDSEEERISHSTSQMSYDQRTGNLD